MGSLVVDPGKDHVLVEELAGPTASLFNRHLSVSKEWYPFETCLGTRPPTSKRRNGTPRQYPLSQGVQSAIIVNVLTEDNLPYYTHTLMSPIKPGHPLRDWSRRWTAEEWRHSAAIRDWILATRRSIPTGWRTPDGSDVKGTGPQSNSVAEMISYVSFQELATQVAHRNTARPGQDDARQEDHVEGRRRRGLHHAFYRDLVLGPRDRPVAMSWRSRVSSAVSRCQGPVSLAYEHEEAIALAGISARTVRRRSCEADTRLLADIRHRRLEPAGRPGAREDRQEPCRPYPSCCRSTGTHLSPAGLRPADDLGFYSQLATRSLSKAGNDIVATPMAESPMPYGRTRIPMCTSEPQE